MAVSDQTMLDNVDAAINAILSGNYESVSAAGRSLTRLNLDKLWAMKKELETRIEAGTEGGNGLGIVLGVFGEQQAASDT